MAYSDIKDPSAHFQTALWTGDGLDNKQITNDGNSDLQPDWVWLKDRTQAESHAVFDSTRGATVRLQPNNNNAESTETATLKSFTTDGFTVGTSGSVNNGSNPDQYVAWQWKANGGTTSSNTDGSITSTVQANTTSGFSIITYTGNATDNATVGHGLGVAPSVIIIKDLTDGSVWGVWHKDLTDAGYRLTLSTNGAPSNDSGFMGGGNRTLPTSSVFSLGAGGGGNGTNAYIAYCFAEKQGYSKFGKYVGNGNANGPFVYTGFKPAFLMMKRTDSTGNWVMFDNKRDTHNVTKHRLFPNLTNSDNTTRNYIDLLSNGFKMRDTDVDHNASGASIIYMAFAENPFVAGGIPTTAR